MDPDPIRDTILEVVEACLDAQLRAVRKLRSTSSTDSSPGVPRWGAKNIKGRSQLDMAFDILKEEGRPLHISELLERIETRFGQRANRESLVSALTKRVPQADRFVRTQKNTFGLRQASVSSHGIRRMARTTISTRRMSRFEESTGDKLPMDPQTGVKLVKQAASEDRRRAPDPLHFQDDRFDLGV
jgi:HB1, ASXL, restriction endonuclease HTH domain